MQESCSIAHTYAKSFLNSYYSQNEKISLFFDKNDIHIHFAEGAIPRVIHFISKGWTVGWCYNTDCIIKSSS